VSGYTTGTQAFYDRPGDHWAVKIPSPQHNHQHVGGSVGLCYGRQYVFPVCWHKHKNAPLPHLFHTNNTASGVSGSQSVPGMGHQPAEEDIGNKYGKALHWKHACALTQQYVDSIASNT